jgi:hypothetical protein
MLLVIHLHAEFKNKQSYYVSVPPNALMAWTETTLPPFLLQKLSTDVHNSRHAVSVTRRGSCKTGHLYACRNTQERFSFVTAK